MLLPTKQLQNTNIYTCNYLYTSNPRAVRILRLNQTSPANNTPHSPIFFKYSTLSLAHLHMLKSTKCIGKGGIFLGVLPSYEGGDQFPLLYAPQIDRFGGGSGPAGGGAAVALAGSREKGGRGREKSVRRVIGLSRHPTRCDRPCHATCGGASRPGPAAPRWSHVGGRTSERPAWRLCCCPPTGVTLLQAACCCPAASRGCC